MCPEQYKAALNTPKNILFVSAFHAPFIEEDLELLRRNHSVRARIGNGFFQVLSIAWGAIRSDLVYCWFASVYASVGVAFARLFGARSVIIVGGVDVAAAAEIGYGIWLSPWKARLIGYALRRADRVCVVDPSLAREAIARAGYPGKNILYLPTGYDPALWKPLGPREQQVLTVAIVRDMVTFRRKGIDLLIAAAGVMPECEFVVVGVSEHIRRSVDIPPNMKLMPPVPRTELLPYYRRAKVYCQPSRWEGLPNALCEAMLCGCYPVASEIFGNPTAVGDTGLLIPAGDAAALVPALRKALAVGEEDNLRARQRIVSLFPRERRESMILNLIGELCR